MKPSEPVDTGQHDMFRSRLDQIIHMRHEKVVLANRIDWQFLSDTCGENYTDKPGHPALPIRLPLGGAMLPVLNIRPIPPDDLLVQFNAEAGPV